MSFFTKLFSSDGFMPHGHCYLWDPWVVWLHVISDSLIALAYLTIPVTLLYIARKRQDLPFDWMFVCFGVFILSCGATHGLEVWTLWHPTYWLSGGMKAITAASSIATAMLLVRLIPRLLAIPSTATLRAANEALAKESGERQRTEEKRQRQRTELRVLFDFTPAMLMFKDTENRILRVNKRAAAHFGKSIEELEGRSFLEIYPQDAARFHRDDLEVIRSGLPQLGLIEAAPGPDGTQLWIQKDKIPVCDADGKVIGVVVMAQDITVRRRAEAELSWKTAFLEAQVNSSIDGILLVDPDGKRALQNQRFVELLKIPQAIADEETDENRLRWVRDMTKNPEQFTAKVAHLYAHRDETSHDEIELKDGTVLYRYSAPVLGHEGKYYGRIWTFRDITERKRTDDALRASNEKFHQLANNITDAFWIRSPDLREVHYVSPAFQRIWGRSVASLHANPKQWTDFILPADRERVQAAFATLTGEARSMDIEYRIVRPDGEIRWVRVRGFQVRDAGDQVIRLTGIVTDITGQRQAADELRESQRFAESIAENSTSLIYIFEPETGRSVYSNRNVAEFLGYSPAQIAEFGENILPRVMHPEDLPRIARHHAAYADVADSRIFDLEFRLRHANGEWRWIWARETVFKRRPDGAAWQILGTAQDITERRRIEEELSAAKEAAEAANQAKSEFLANMSHEIRTPMNGIIGMTDLLLETNLGREQREYLGMAKSSAQSLLGLINDILDFSKIEAGKLELEAISFSLRDCLGTMLKPLGMRADRKGIELTADIPADVPDHLLGDPLRLRQILINLTDNAIKFTDRGDVMLRITLESDAPSSPTLREGAGTPGVEDAESVGDDGAALPTATLHFSVTDTGIGIPADKQALIFEAFAQADGTTTRTYGGTGLGLAITSQLVRQMGGHIWVESAVGKGTTFHFTMRLPVRDTPAPDVRPADPRRLQGLRVLVVDDNAVNRRILHAMLAHWQMQPAAVASGAAALAELLRAAHAGTPFPLIILDGVMPEMDGFAVAEKIRAHPELTGATVMMLSSAMPAGAAVRCGELGVASYLTKPVGQFELLDAILLAVGGEALAEPAAPIAPIVPATVGLRILLAEDNVINRALAISLLEKRGHSVVPAVTGREAVASAAGEAFDLIFMDVQMPEMDGLEATRRIRTAEQATGRHTPIVAMTAHAMAGDRERCLAAGMDEYLSKPLQKPALLALLATISPSSSSAPIRARRKGSEPGPDVPGPAALESAPLFDRGKLLADLDGDEVLLQRVIVLFHENTRRLLENIRGAIVRRHSGDLGLAAHALLSPLGTFGASHAHRLTRQLAAQAQEENYEHTDQTFAALERETAKICTALAESTPAGE